MLLGRETIFPRYGKPLDRTPMTCKTVAKITVVLTREIQNASMRYISDFLHDTL